ncbi:MAG: hypothetical protein KDJ19_08555, partial [Hyphomicrobiaceae bacterium]|nr:hypothetical protein [Hyphomicrobiaceae bacterium]
LDVTDVNEAPTDMEFTGDQSTADKQVLSLNDGENDQYAAASNFSDFPTSAISFEVMMNADYSNIHVNGSPIVSYDANSHPNEFTILARADDYATNPGGLSVYINNQVVEVPNLASGLYDGTDHRFSVTWQSSTGTLKIYVDGQQEYTTTVKQGTTLATGGTLVFGQEQDSVGGSFNTDQIFVGTMDDIRLFSDVRTATEISDNADSPIADPSSEQGLVSNWQMTDNGSGKIEDLAGSHDLTLSGGATLIGDTYMTAGTVVGDVSSVTDPDTGDTFTYSLLDDAGGKYVIDANTGEIKLAADHDLTGTVDSDTVTVQVMDAGGNTYSETVGIVLGTDGSDTITGTSNADIIYAGDANDGQAAAANSVSVTNNSFETQNLNNATSQSGAPTGWSGTGTVGVRDTDGSEITGGSGENAAYTNDNSTISQILSTSFDSANNYDVSLKVGILNGSSNTPYVVNIYAGSTLIGTYSATISSGSAGTYQTVSFNVDGTGLEAYDGQSLKIELGKNSTTGGAVYFDNVQVTENVPEIVGGDTIDAGAGNDTIYGSSGDDIVSAGTGDDYAYLGDGDDTFDTTSGSSDDNDGADYVDGGAGNDTIWAGGDDDTIFGGAGDDTLSGEAGNDTIDGGDGTDTAIYTGNRTDYDVTFDGTNFTITDLRSGSPDGTDTVANVENFLFADGTVTADNLIANVAPTDMTFAADATFMDNKLAASLDINASGSGLTASSGMDIDNQTQFTVELKVNFASIPGSGYGGDLFSQCDSWDQNGCFLNIYDGQIGYNQYSGGSWQGGAYSSAGVLTPGVDYTISLVVNSGTATIYVDGVQVASGSVPSPMANSSAPMSFLNNADASVTEIRVWDPALSQSQIQANLDADLTTGSQTGLMGLYTFDEGSGSTVFDQTSGGHNLTLNSAESTWVAGTDIADGSVIGSVSSVTDLTYGDTHTFSLIDDAGGKFAIDANTGDISIVGNHDTSSAYSDTITVKATDSHGATYTETVGIQIGTDGADTLIGTAGTDIFQGGDGDDTIRLSSGADSIEGGSGHDVLDVWDEGGVTIDLQAGTVTGGDSDGTTISGIEEVWGSAAGDTIIGADDTGETIYGYSGDDVIQGGGGNDDLYGEAGNDEFVIGIGDGDDNIYGGSAGGWTDQITLTGMDGAVTINGSVVEGNGWTMTLDSGSSIVSQNGESLTLSDDSSGTIVFDDGAVATFHQIEQINW